MDHEMPVFGCYTDVQEGVFVNLFCQLFRFLLNVPKILGRGILPLLTSFDVRCIRSKVVLVLTSSYQLLLFWLLLVLALSRNKYVSMERR